jgi:hypothetical protein
MPEPLFPFESIQRAIAGRQPCSRLKIDKLHLPAQPDGEGNAMDPCSSPLYRKSTESQMVRREILGSILSAALIGVCSSASAGWGFNGTPSPNAFIQAGKMTLELQCDRVRFAPTGYEDARDIERKQGLSIRFMKDGATQIGAFQVGGENGDIRIVDNFPVEVVFHDKADYGFVLDQIGKNAVMNLAMVDGDVSYGIFDLKGRDPGQRSSRCARPALRGRGLPRHGSKRPSGWSTAAAGPSSARSNTESSTSPRTSGTLGLRSTAIPCAP